MYVWREKPTYPRVLVLLVTFRKERMRKMKVVAINGSHKMGEGNTALVLNPFLEGMRMSSETLKAFSRELMTIEQYVQGTNQFFQQMLDAL